MEMHMIFIIYLTLMIILFSVMTYANRKYSANRKLDQQVDEIMQDVQKGVTMESYQEHLNFMFQLGIINSIEYNNFLNDGIPFVKRNRP